MTNVPNFPEKWFLVCSIIGWIIIVLDARRRVDNYIVEVQGSLFQRFGDAPSSLLGSRSNIRFSYFYYLAFISLVYFAFLAFDPAKKLFVSETGAYQGAAWPIGCALVIVGVLPSAPPFEYLERLLRSYAQRFSGIWLHFESRVNAIQSCEISYIDKALSEKMETQKWHKELRKKLIDSGFDKPAMEIFLKRLSRVEQFSEMALSGNIGLFQARTWPKFIKIAETSLKNSINELDGCISALALSDLEDKRDAALYEVSEKIEEVVQVAAGLIVMKSNFGGKNSSSDNELYKFVRNVLQLNLNDLMYNNVLKSMVTLIVSLIFTSILIAIYYNITFGCIDRELKMRVACEASRQISDGLLTGLDYGLYYSMGVAVLSLLVLVFGLRAWQDNVIEQGEILTLTSFFSLYFLLGCYFVVHSTISLMLTTPGGALKMVSVPDLLYNFTHPALALATLGALIYRGYTVSFLTANSRGRNVVVAAVLSAVMYVVSKLLGFWILIKLAAWPANQAFEALISWRSFDVVADVTLFFIVLVGFSIASLIFVRNAESVVAAGKFS